MSISQNFPAISPSLSLNFARSKTLDPRITFSRTSTATRVNETGLIEVMSADEPRFDHRYENGVVKSLGLLVEESRQNLVTYSEDFSDSSWNKGRTFIQQNATISPSGNLDATKLIEESGATGAHYLGFTYSVTAGEPYTLSFFVKSAEYSKILVYIFGTPGFSDNVTRILFDLNESNPPIVQDGSPISYSIKKYPNGWYRVSGTSVASADGNASFAARLIDENGAIQWTGNGTNGIYIWGAQVEAGQFPTSYIPTSGATVTRGQEKALITGETFNNFFNPTEGFVMGTFNLNGVNTGTDWQTLVTIDDNTANNRLWIYARGGGDITQWIGSSGGSTQFTPVLGANATAGVERTVGGAYALNNMVGVYEGTLTATDTNALLPVGIDRMGIGYRDDNDTGFINGTIKKLFYYPKRLTNAQLQNLTK